MYYRTTLHPGDISTWTPPAEVRQDIPGTNGFTYPNPVLLPAEHDQLYLFFRGADWSVDFARRTRVGRMEPIPRGDPRTRAAALPQGRR